MNNTEMYCIALCTAFNNTTKPIRSLDANITPWIIKCAHGQHANVIFCRIDHSIVQLACLSDEAPAC